MVAKKHEESGNGGQYVVQFANVQNGTEFIVPPVVFREWAFRRQRLRGSPGLAYSWFRHALAIYCFLALLFFGRILVRLLVSASCVWHCVSAGPEGGKERG